jgi:hypothetical protein
MTRLVPTCSALVPGIGDHDLFPPPLSLERGGGTGRGARRTALSATGSGIGRQADGATARASHRKSNGRRWQLPMCPAPCASPAALLGDFDHRLAQPTVIDATPRNHSARASESATAIGSPPRTTLFPQKTPDRRDQVCRLVQAADLARPITPICTETPRFAVQTPDRQRVCRSPLPAHGPHLHLPRFLHD